MPHSTAQSVDHAARTYAQALFDLAVQQDKLAPIAEQLADLGRYWQEHEQLRRLLASRVIGKAEREGILQRMFQGRVDDLLYRFLQVVNQHDRMGHLPAMVAAFDEKVDEQMGRVEVDVYVAQPLNDQQLQEVKDDIGQALGKTAQVDQHIDPQLLGGLKLRIGDRLIDGSVAAQLRQMRDRMKQAGREAGERVVVKE